MSDEVKQAAERLRLGGYSSLDDLDEYYMSSRKFEDMGILSDAYLAEHDDSEQTAKENATLLTAEILQASGWVPSVAGTIWDHQMTRMQLRVDVNNWHVSVCGVRIGTVETVGDLRKLLEALHVPAVVVVPKGGE